MTTTIIVLGAFAFLNILGIGESAVVALIIFIIHIVTLILLCLLGISQVFSGNFEIIKDNWAQVSMVPRNLIMTFFLGFSASLLGVSGFESSANFVEEQQPGVFRKTLRNMWLLVLIFNPLISFIALNIISLSQIKQKQDYLLAHLGNVLAGDSLQIIIVVDAFLVLSGAVLTSYVGVTGLVRRMTLDQCLPQFLLKKNRQRGTYHRIIIGFFLLCTSILILTRGNIFALAGVYTISFLGVMGLFALGNILLKVNRKELKRTFRASWLTVFSGFLAVLIGIAGNIVIDFKNLLYFLTYFIPTVVVITIVYGRIKLLKFIVQIENRVMKKFFVYGERELMGKFFLWRSMLVDKIMEITSQEVLVFTRGGNLPKLRRAFDYIIKNEDSQKVYVVYLQNDPDNETVSRLKSDLEVLNRAYPEIQIEFITRKGNFGPETVKQISEEMKIPLNNMFIGAPEEKHSFTIQDLGGVRVIF